MIELSDYPGYFITECGKVYSNRRGGLKEIKLSVNKGGYYYCNFRKDGKTITSQIHRLVALTYLSCDDTTLVVNHIDCNKLNNHIKNLEFVSHKENTKHAARNNLLTVRRGTESNLSKHNLQETDIYFIRHISVNKIMSHSKIAMIYRISKSMISQIKNRQVYGWI